MSDTKERVYMIATIMGLTPAKDAVPATIESPEWIANLDLFTHKAQGIKDAFRLSCGRTGYAISDPVETRELAILNGKSNLMLIGKSKTLRRINAILPK